MHLMIRQRTLRRVYLFQLFNEKMKIDDVLRRVPNNGNVDIEYWRGKKLYKKSFKYSKRKWRA